MVESKLKLTGLNKVPGKDPAARDRRWIARQNAWDQAQQAKNLLLEQDSESLRVYVTRSAKPCGFWSVWATVFKDDSDKIDYNDSICKVSIVGVGMKSHTGVASKAFTAMAKDNININIISTSEIKISMIT